jgi:hypothetical protein
VEDRILKVVRHYERLGLAPELAYCATVYRCLRLRVRAAEIEDRGEP